MTRLFSGKGIFFIGSVVCVWLNVHTSCTVLNPKPTEGGPETRPPSVDET